MNKALKCSVFGQVLRTRLASIVYLDPATSERRVLPSTYNHDLGFGG
jgi:hypothetical protein